MIADQSLELNETDRSLAMLSHDVAGNTWDPETLRRFGALHVQLYAMEWSKVVVGSLGTEVDPVMEIVPPESVW